MKNRQKYRTTGPYRVWVERHVTDKSEKFIFFSFFYVVGLCGGCCCSLSVDSLKRCYIFSPHIYMTIKNKILTRLGEREREEKGPREVRVCVFSPRWYFNYADVYKYFFKWEIYFTSNIFFLFECQRAATISNFFYFIPFRFLKTYILNCHF